MDDKELNTKFDKIFAMFLEYEVANSFIASIMPFDFVAKMLYKRTLRKLKRCNKLYETKATLCKI